MNSVNLVIEILGFFTQTSTWVLALDWDPAGSGLLHQFWSSEPNHRTNFENQFWTKLPSQEQFTATVFFTVIASFCAVFQLSTLNGFWMVSRHPSQTFSNILKHQTTYQIQLQWMKSRLRKYKWLHIALIFCESKSTFAYCHRPNSDVITPPFWIWHFNSSGGFYTTTLKLLSLYGC